MNQAYLVRRKRGRVNLGRFPPGYEIIMLVWVGSVTVMLEYSSSNLSIRKFIAQSQRSHVPGGGQVAVRTSLGGGT